MNITVFELNWKDKRIVQSIMNRNELHRDVQAMFHGDRNAARNVYRVVERKGKLLLYLYSEKPVDRSMAHFGMKYLGEGVVPKYHTGDRVQIDMLVTPIRTMACEDGRRRKRPIFDPDGRLQWCRRKASENGFQILDIREVKREKLHIDKHDNKPWIVDAYEYQLSADIFDEDRFSQCLLNGFGRNASYGAGMMIIR